MSSFLVSVLVLAVSCVVVSAGNREGDSCTLPVSGTTGVCTHISKCKPVLQAALEGVNPEKICSHIGTVSVVCCDANSISADDSTDRKEGDSCTLRDSGATGTCTRFAQCAAAKESAAQGIFPQKCNTSLNRDDLVCCGPGSGQAKKYCGEISSKIQNCPSVQSPTTSTSSRPASEEKPHMALLGSGEESSGINWWCTGVLISERYVLTAARCLEVEGLKYAKLGAWNPNVMGYDNLYVISQKVPHPDYEVGSSSRYNDLGLLKLERRVVISDTLFPACLHTGTSLPNKLIVSKWNGAQNYFKWPMEEVSLAECTQHFASNGILPEGIKNASQSCTRLKNGATCLHFPEWKILSVSPWYSDVETVLIKAEPGPREEDGQGIPYTEIDIDLTDVKKECLEFSERASDMIPDQKTHLGEKPHSCSHCNYTCSKKSDLTRHLRTHTGEKPHSCLWCNYSCSEKSHLTVHLRTHTGEKPYSCPHCNYAFSHKSHYTRHLRTHTGEKPHSCPHCNFSCPHKSNLTRHLRTHTSEKPFSCPQCNFSYSDKSKLTKHLRNHSR